MKKCHKVDYTLIGDDMQLVEIKLDPNEKIIAEAGAMTYMDNNIDFDTKMGDGSQANNGLMGALKGIGKRLLTGESLFLTHFENIGYKKQKIAFGAPYPGKTISIDLDKMNGKIICQKDAFLCAVFGTQISIAFNKRIGSEFFSGEGFILQKLIGDGRAFIYVGGSVIRKDLKHNETLKVDSGCLAAMSTSIDYTIAKAKNLKSMTFGGESFFLAHLKDPGTVYIQSLPFSRIVDRMIEITQTNQGEESALGLLGINKG